MPPFTIVARAGVTAGNLITTFICSAFPLDTGRKPQAPQPVIVPRSPPEERLHARIAKQAIWVPLNEDATQPPGSPQVLEAVVHVPHGVPGPTEPHAAAVFGIPVLGSSRTAPPMSEVSEMMPMRTPARAAPAASMDSQ